MPECQESALRRELEALRTENAKLRERLGVLESDIAKYLAVMEGTTEGILLMRETFSDCNESACRIWKCDRGDIIGYSPAKFAPPFQPSGRDSEEMAREKVRAALAGTPQRFYWKDRRGDGTLTDTEVYLKAVTINGEDYVVATIRDITGELRKEKERQLLFDRMERIIETRNAELRSSHDALNDERTYRTQVERDLERADLELNHVFEASTDGLIVTDTHKNILKINRAFSELSGFGRTDIEARKCFEVFPCVGCEPDRCNTAARLKGRDRADYETECVTASGETLACAVTATKLKDSRGTPIGKVVSYRNITNYKKWVEALQHSEELHRITLASISDAVFITDSNGNFHYVSPSVEAVFGFSENEVWWKGTISSLLGENFFSMQELEKKGEIENIELSVPDKQGATRELMVNVKRVNIQSGTVLVTCRDVTEKRRAEREAQLKQEQLVQAGKMVSLGILVSGVAHEVNNPNNYIMLNSQLLARMWKGATPILERYFEENGDFLLGGLPYSRAREKAPHLLESMMEGAGRIKRIVQDLKDYARHDSMDMNQTVYLNSVIKHSLNLLGNQIRKSTDHFSIEYGKSRPRVRGNFQKVEQVFINLVQNACEALPDTTRAIRIKSFLDIQAGTVGVIVADEGCGIAAKDLPHLTDPFFTTKRSIGGTGLGLSVSHKIVQEHQGTLTFDSVPGEGTTAVLTLPATIPGSES